MLTFERPLAAAVKRRTRWTSLNVILNYSKITLRLSLVAYLKSEADKQTLFFYGIIEKNTRPQFNLIDLMQ